MFTRKEIEEISQALEARGKKDSQFPLAEKLDGNEEVAILQNKSNRRTTLNDIFTFYKDYIVPPILSAIEVVENSIEELGKEIDTELSSLQTTVSSKIDSSESGITSTINGYITDSQEYIESIVREYGQKILDKFGDTSFEHIESSLLSAVDNSTKSIIDDIAATYLQIKGDIDNLDTSISGDIEAVEADIEASISNLETSVKGYIDALESSLKTWLETEFNTVLSSIEGAVDSLNTSIGSHIDESQQAVEDVIAELKSSMDSQFTALSESLQTVYNNILIRLNTVESNIQTSISDASKIINDNINKSTESLGESIADVQNTIPDILSAYNEENKQMINQANAEIISMLQMQDSFWKSWKDRLCTLYVYTQAEDAVITLNNKEISNITAPAGYLVNIRITAPGYNTFNEVVNLWRDQSLAIVLEPTVVSDNHTIQVVTDPSDATVTMNNIVGSTQVFTTGERVHIKIEREHYTTQEFDIVVSEDHIYEVTLVADKITFTITPTPSDAVVVINGKTVSNITVDYNTSIEWSVSRVGYISKSGNLSLTEDTVLPVTLAKQQVTVTFQSVPSDAVIKLNGVEQTSVTVEYGDTISYEVSADGYLTAVGSVVADATETVTIVLKKTYVMIVQGMMTFIAEGETKPADIKSNTGWIFK